MIDPAAWAGVVLGVEADVEVEQLRFLYPVDPNVAERDLADQVGVAGGETLVSQMATQEIFAKLKLVGPTLP